MTQKRKLFTINTPIDKAIAFMSKNHKADFNPSDLYRLVQDGTLTLYGRFTGFVVHFRKVHDGIFREFGDPVANLRRHQGYIRIPSNCPLLEEVICKVGEDTSTLRVDFSRTIESWEDRYSLLHDGINPPFMEVREGINQLAEPLATPEFYRADLVIQTEELYSKFKNESV